MLEINSTPCRHCSVCGGCTYQDISYADELAMKEENLRQLLAPYRDKFEGVLPAPDINAYRNKMEFAFGDESKNGGLALGVRKRRNFYEVVTPEDCRIIPPDFKIILLTVLAYFKERGEAFYHRRRHTGTLRYLILRRGAFTGEVLVNLVTTSGLHQPDATINQLADIVCSLPLSGTIAGFLHTVNDGVADTVKNENVHLLRGRNFFYEKLLGLTFKVSAFSFFQTNSAGAERLYTVVKDCMGEGGGTLYDLYCGTGTIAQIISADADNVIGVEISEEAAEAAKENARLNGIGNCRFIAGDVLSVADNLSGKPDTIVVDPPRDGLHPKVLPQIINMNAKKIVYVSCKPASLVRDLTLLTKNGYQAERLIGVDMFPKTPHIESVCLLSRKHTII